MESSLDENVERVSEDVDVLSNLSDDILAEILSRLSIKKAMKTSVLSHRWTDVWKSIPRLVFYMAEFFRYRNISSIQASESVCQMMTRVMRNLRAPLESCEIHHFPLHTKIGKVEEWMRILVQEKDVKDLAFICDIDTCWRLLGETHSFDERPLLKTPLEIFSRPSLHSLHLSYYSLATEQGFVRCRNLKTLKLINIRFTSNTINQIITNCPCLEELVIRFCSGMNAPLKIDNSNLKFLEVFDGEEDLGIDVIAPNLDVIFVWLAYYSSRSFVIRAPKVMLLMDDGLPCGSYAGYNLAGIVSQRAKAADYISMLSCEHDKECFGYEMLHAVGTLSVNVDLTSPIEAKIMSILLARAQLCTLEIKMKSKTSSQEENRSPSEWPYSFWSCTHQFNCFDNDLMLVSIVSFSGSSEEEMDFVSNLVMRAKLLKNLYIYYDDSAAETTKAAIARLEKLPKANEKLLIYSASLTTLHRNLPEFQ